jgi:hypothetical protein
MRWVGHVARAERGENLYRILVGKPEVKRPLERSRRRWEDKMDVRETGWGGWIGFTLFRTGTFGRLL